MMTDLRKHSDSGGAGNWGGDAYPGEQPQAENDAEQERDAYKPLRADYTAEGESAIPKEYNWSLTGTHISVSDSFEHNDLFDAMNHTDNSRPHAWGTVQVSYNWEAVWEISGSNMSLGMVESRLRKYSKDQGWQHVNIIDHEGMPMGSMKVASAQVMYHVAPRSARESIMANGLDPAFDQTGHGAVFLTDTMPQAGPHSDVWEVQGEYEPDPTEHNTGEDWRASWDGIPPNRLRLLSEGTTARTAGYWDRSERPPKWVNGPDPTTVPQSINDLLGYEDNCYEAAAGLADDFPGVKGVSGTHNGSPHAWTEGPDGTIYDAARWTVADGDPDPVAIIPPDDPRYQGYLKLGTTAKTAADPGVGDGNYPDKIWKVHDWPADLAQDVPSYMFENHPDEEVPRGPIPCSECGQVLPTFAEWRKHVDQYHLNPNKEPHTLVSPVIDHDQAIPADFDTLAGPESYDTGNRAIMMGAVQEIRQNFVLAAGANEMIPGPIPFVFDIENDKVLTGHPGERHSDIKGQFTPGGIVEGLYAPNGKMQFRTDTDMPYTVRHMVQLWQSMHPELVVKSVEKLMNGKPYKLASANIAHKVRSLAMADDAVSNVYNAVQNYGNVYVVGGAVRDAVLGKIPKDIDLMVQGIPMSELEQMIRQLPGKVDLTGKAFGVLRYKSPDGSEVEIALPRKEQSTGEGHKDFAVEADPYLTADEDLSRRDFTGNSMCVNLKTGELLDPFGGALDLKNRTLKTTWDGAFREDPLRTVRALSSVSRHGLMPDKETMDQMRLHSPNIEHLPNERVQAELDKIFSGDDPEKAMRVARDTGVLEHIFPEIKPSIGFDQRNKHHRLPLDDHLLEVLRGTQEQTQDKDLRLAAFLHDIGKPGSFWQDEDGFGHYYKSDSGQGQNHEELGASMTRSAMSRLKYPNARVDRVTHLVQHHMFAPFDSLKAARRRINQVGEDHIQDLLTLRQADGQGKGTSEWEQKTPVNLQRQLAQQVMDEQQPTGISSLVINGNDLKALGLPPGPLYGQILNQLSDKVIDDPSLNNRNDLLALAQEIASNQKTGKTANILDPVQESLDPDVFDNPAHHTAKLKPKIADWVKSFIFNTMTQAEWPDPHDYVSLVLTGSLCTYQWGIASDFDVSLWLDLDKFPEAVRGDLIALMTSQCDGTMVPGTTHPIQCFVVDTEHIKNYSDLYKPGIRSAWDIDQKDWIVYPEHERSHDVKKEFPAAFAYAQIVRDKLVMLLKYDPPMVKVAWDNLHRQRHNDMLAGLGDFSGSNIAYKMVANSGLFPLIAQSTGEYIAKTAMAADPDFINHWIATNGPYVYHGVREGHDPQQILQQGILPGQREYDDYGGDPHKMEDWQMDDWWHTPRPNHVFMVTDPKKAYGNNLMRVDLRKLDPANINPDDDFLRDAQGETGVPDIHYKNPDAPTLGEQAEQVGWGDDPTQTQRSFTDYGVISHRGPIPPEAIEHIGTRREDGGSDMAWRPLEAPVMASKTILAKEWV